jgi:hypothetical protein
MGGPFSVVNRHSTSQRALHKSHSSDSFPFVILWIHGLDGKLCDVDCSIMPCDLTDVIFISSMSGDLTDVIFR